MTSDEAMAFGLIDQVVDKRPCPKSNSQPFYIWFWHVFCGLIKNPLILRGFPVQK